MVLPCVVARISASFGASSCARALPIARPGAIVGHRGVFVDGKNKSTRRLERSLVSKVSANSNQGPHAEKRPSKKSGMKPNTHTAGAHLSPDEQGLLETMPESGWKQSYVELHEFWEKNGHCSPFESSVRDLGHWVKEVRHNRHEGTLDHVQIMLLNSLNFDWESGAAEWMQNALKVKALCVGERCTVSRKDDPELGEWLSDQRAANRHNRLAKARTHYLTAMGILHEDAN
mmetsp:Transcript_34680/g.58268  ORF Transcript_34680/g.58268 Transcript_34680/m.58268 type:complete len:231 (+) Transcript_34680:166-858(+)